MTSQVFAEDLENEIGLMEQELLMKRVGDCNIF